MVVFFFLFCLILWCPCPDFQNPLWLFVYLSYISRSYWNFSVCVISLYCRFGILMSMKICKFLWSYHARLLRCEHILLERCVTYSFNIIIWTDSFILITSEFRVTCVWYSSSIHMCQDCCCAGSRSGRLEAAGLAPDGGEGATPSCRGACAWGGNGWARGLDALRSKWSPSITALVSGSGLYGQFT